MKTNKDYKWPYLTMILSIVLVLSSCEKFLDEKSDEKLAVPSTLEDLQALLDDYPNVGITAAEGEMSTPDYYLTDDDWNKMPESERNIYIWNSEILHTDLSINDWGTGYKQVYYANLVLENLEKISITDNNQAKWQEIKGEALVFRASSLLGMTFVWTLAYNESTADTDLGLPLKTNTNYNEVSVRSTLRETYSFIIKDLTVAAELLPLKPQSKYRPSKPAAYGFLARAYLAMRDYEHAYQYADACLQIYSELINYNNLPIAKNYPLPSTNDNVEIIFFEGFNGSNPLTLSKAKISPQLYKLYDDDDLRKGAFFRLNNDDSYRFKGNYSGTSEYFGGIATDEVYLIKAECLARAGKVKQALEVMNHLLSKRWLKIDGESKYEPIAITSAEMALKKILEERHKELLMRGLRWMDIKRLNLEGANISLSRTVNGKKYMLPPNDLRFALSIPEDVIQISGMQQNLR